MDFQVEKQKIERLLRSKFPGSWAPPPISPVGHNNDGLRGGREDGASHRKMMDDIAAARAALWAMPAPERDAQYETLVAAEAKQKRLLAEVEESRYSFNQRDALADFEYWSKADSWTLDESVALLLGRAPEKVKWSGVQSCVNVSTFARNFSRLRELGLRSNALNHGITPNSPSVVLDWAADRDIPIPEGLSGAMEKRRVKASASRPSAEPTTLLNDTRQIEYAHVLLIPAGKKMFALEEIPTATAAAIQQEVWGRPANMNVPEERLLFALNEGAHRQALREAISSGRVVPFSRVLGIPVPRQSEPLTELMLPLMELRKFADLLLIEVREQDEQVAPPSEPLTEGGTTGVHRLQSRTDALSAVLAMASAAASDPNDYQNVWASLVRMAQTPIPPAPLIGYVDGEGVQYQTAERDVPKYLTKDALRKRMSRRTLA